MTRQQWARLGRIAARVALTAVAAGSFGAAVWAGFIGVTAATVDRIIVALILESISLILFCYVVTVLIEIWTPLDPGAEYLRDRLRAQVKGRRR